MIRKIIKSFLFFILIYPCFPFIWKITVASLEFFKSTGSSHEIHSIKNEVKGTVSIPEDLRQAKDDSLIHSINSSLSSLSYILWDDKEELKLIQKQQSIMPEKSPFFPYSYRHKSMYSLIISIVVWSFIIKMPLLILSLEFTISLSREQFNLLQT